MAAKIKTDIDKYRNSQIQKEEDLSTNDLNTNTQKFKNRFIKILELEKKLFRAKIVYQMNYSLIY